MEGAPSRGFRPLHLTTAAETPRGRAELAREVFGRQIFRLDVDPLPDMDFHVDLKLLSLSGLKVISGRSSGMVTSRTPSLLSDGNDDIFITLTLGGRMFREQRNRQVTLEAGSMHLASNAERMTNVHLHSHSRGVLAPRKAIAALVPDLDDRIGQPLPSNSDGFVLLRNYATALNLGDKLSDPAVVPLAVTHIYDLIALTVGAGRDAGEIAAARGLKAARLVTVKAYIAEHLADNLSVGAVALAHGLTERYMQRLFEDDGTTFSTYVQHQRLAAAHEMLSEAQWANRGIGVVAYDCGFGDISHFNRVFKRRYGATPTDIQMASRRSDR